MKTTQNTILITGGSAGIGYEIAKLFSQSGNKVIITGRDENRLQLAAKSLPQVIPIVSDVSKEEDVNSLVQRMMNEFPDLNIVINNAGRALVYDVTDGSTNVYDNATEEIQTNYLSVVRLNEKLLPLLKKQPEAAIVNVSSIVAFVPNPLVGYSASKAALHSYTQALRIALAGTSAIKVFELMPPLVNTEFSQAIGGHLGISPTVVAQDLVQAMQEDHYEIRVGDTEQLYQFISFLSRASAGSLKQQQKAASI